MTIPGQLGLPLQTPRPRGAGAALSDSLCALIVRRGRPLEVGQVASQLLRLRRCPENLQRRLVAQIVEGDSRLAWLGRDLIGLAPQDWATREARHGSFCVVDLETTGGSPGFSKITEIGAVRVRDMRIVDRFVTLVDPGRPIPQMITGLTGIDDAMVDGAPLIDQALAEFIAFAGDDVLVAHNAPFDLRFLNHERRRVMGNYFTQPWLDTLTMARRLLGGRVARNDLTTLAEWADTDVRPRHRALPDAEATAELLLRFLDMLAQDGHDTLERVVAFAAPGGTRHSWKLTLADDLPQSPGVYLMRDRRGGVLYVGKARNLRRRVRSYFGPGGKHGRLIGRALEQLDHLDYEVCESDLDALLRESVLLRELRPPCNRRGLGFAGRALSVTGEAFARIRVGEPARGDAAARVLTRLGSERGAAAALRLLHTLYPVRDCDTLCPPQAGLAPARECEGPCGRGDEAAHRAAVEDVAGLFGTHPGPALAGLGARLVAAGRGGRWVADEAGLEGMRTLLGAARREWRRRDALTRTAVLVEPSGLPGRAVVFGIANGHCVTREACDADTAGAVAAAAVAGVLGAIGAEPRPVDEEAAGILEQRLRDTGAPGAVLLDASDLAHPEPAVARVRHAVAWGIESSLRGRAENDDPAG